MEFVDIFLSILVLILDILSNPLVFFLLVILLIVYHLLLIGVRDRKYVLDFRKWDDTKPGVMKNLN